jgi:hypothetical protein
VAQKRVLVVYGVRYTEYAGAFVAALRQREPDYQYVLLDDAAVATFDEGELAQYDRLIVLLAPDLIYGQTAGSVRLLLQRYAALWDGGRRQIIPVVLLPVGKPEFVALPRPVVVERRYAAQVADIIAGAHLLDSLPNDGRPDDEYAWPEEYVRGISLPPPAYPPDTTPPAPPQGEASDDDITGWFDREEERSAPPPPPAPAPRPAPQPAPAPEQPAAQPPAPPPAPGGLPSRYLDQVGGDAGERQRGGEQQGVPRLRPVETLQFTAYHPGATPVEAAQTLLVYSHIAEQAHKVRSDAGTFAELGSMPQVAKGVSLRKVPRNVEITVEPHVEGVTFSPTRDRFIWEGEWRRSLFRYTGAKELAGTTQTGWIDIYAGRVSPICTITVSLTFLGSSPVASLSVPHGINVTSNVFDKVFISYSHRDREPMRQAREIYESLGVTAYHDDLLEAGDSFELRLAEMIRAANVFHLLWSDAAAQSPEVRKEWLLALQTSRDARFIRPWYWQQPLAPPPDELRARKISFRYEHLRRSLFRPSTWR